MFKQLSWFNFTIGLPVLLLFPLIGYTQNHDSMVDEALEQRQEAQANSYFDNIVVPQNTMREERFQRRRKTTPSK